MDVQINPLSHEVEANPFEEEVSEANGTGSNQLLIRFSNALMLHR